MTDIVERLLAFHQRERERGGDMMTYGEGCPLAVEAAKEIENLRTELATARRLGLHPGRGDMVSCDPVHQGAAHAPANVGKTYKL